MSRGGVWRTTSVLGNLVVVASAALGVVLGAALGVVTGAYLGAQANLLINGRPSLHGDFSGLFAALVGSVLGGVVGVLTGGWTGGRAGEWFTGGRRRPARVDRGTGGGETAADPGRAGESGAWEGRRSEGMPNQRM